MELNPSVLKKQGWFFFPAKNLSLRRISNLIYLLFLLTFQRCFSLILRIGATTGSTMVKVSECLTRAWSLSIKKRKINQVTLIMWMFSNPFVFSSQWRNSIRRAGQTAIRKIVMLFLGRTMYPIPLYRQEKIIFRSQIYHHQSEKWSLDSG